MPAAPRTLARCDPVLRSDPEEPTVHRQPCRRGANGEQETPRSAPQNHCNSDRGQVVHHLLPGRARTDRVRAPHPASGGLVLREVMCGGRSRRGRLLASLVAIASERDASSLHPAAAQQLMMRGSLAGCRGGTCHSPLQPLCWRRKRQPRHARRSQLQRSWQQRKPSLRTIGTQRACARSSSGPSCSRGRGEMHGRALACCRLTTRPSRRGSPAKRAKSLQHVTLPMRRLCHSQRTRQLRSPLQRSQLLRSQL